MALGAPATVTRGRITVPARGITKEFMFNPNDLSGEKSVNYGTLDIPGASHPVYQFGSGGEHLIKFQLYLDGDRGRYGRNGKADGLSVMSEIMWYQALLYPAKYNTLDMSAVFPPTVLFYFGELFNGMECIVKSAPYKVNYWTPKLEPVRATIDITLAEVVDHSVTADEYLGN